MQRFFALTLLIFISFSSCSHAFSLRKKKKVEIKKEKMPETYQQWQIDAQDIPMKDRKLNIIKEPTSDKKNYYPEAHYRFEKYNYPQGTRDLNIQFIKQNLVAYPIIVADITCHYVAYPKYYYSSDIDMIYSEFFVGELDITKTKTQRILNFNHKQEYRTPVIQSGVNEQYRNLFKGLTLVDWDRSSKKILVKEKVGSTLRGIYRTYLYVYYLDTKEAKKLTNIDSALKNYYLTHEKLNLNNYLYEIVPLGFTLDNDDAVAFHLFTFEGSTKIFMGTWVYNLSNDSLTLYSRENPSISVGANGIVLKRVLD